MAFGACHSVAILDTKFQESCKITQTLVKHTGRVNAVKWIKRNDSEREDELISGADDHLAIIWNLSKPEETRILKGHNGGITTVDAIEAGGKLIVVTGSSDSTIKLWEVNANDINCFQEISLKTGFCFAARFAKLPGTDEIVLAYATDDNKIRLLRRKDGNCGQFVPAFQLLGHENWVRGLDFAVDNNSDLLLASCSQDTFIRLWRLSQRAQEESFIADDCLLQLPTGCVHADEQFDSGAHPKLTVILESVLQGHEDWVYGVHWNQNKNELQLLSSSIDKTMIIWSLGEDDVWCEKVRVGEVGGNAMGFYGGKFSCDGRSIIGYGYLGTFHVWHQSAENEKLWEPGVIVGGHFADVRDVCWEPQGQFLFSTAADQTTRVHAPCGTSKARDPTWHELARPQVHGYDMQCLAVLGRYKFASGAEEKVIRVFQAPVNFVRNFRNLCNITSDPDGDEILRCAPVGASLPSLGLSNKAVQKNSSDNVNKEESIEKFNEDLADKLFPPQEETLMQGTLWPETQKLYGHGFEIFALTSTFDGKYLASSCKASSAEHAHILLWDTSSWKQIQKLSSHQLTVTQMRFSRDGRFLLAVSRDRRWSLFENKSTNGASSFELVAMMDKKEGAHTRIIWSCDWSHDSKYFSTCSRDGKLVVWAVASDDDASKVNPHVVASIELKNQSITACAFGYEHYQDQSYLIAFGLETGIIKLCKFDNVLTELISLESAHSHHLTVKQLRFRPLEGAVQLASCGEDHIIRIYEFYT